MDADKPAEVNNGTADWDYHEDHDDDHDADHHVTEVNYYSYDQISYGDGHQPQPPAPVTSDWGQEDADPWGASSPVKETAPAPAKDNQEYAGEIAQAICLYTFDATR